MRISSKLTVIVAAVFMLVGAVGALALLRLREQGEASIVVQAEHMAESMATMAAYELADSAAQPPAAPFQGIINFVSARDRLDLEVVDRRLLIVADSDNADIGKPLEEGARRSVVAQTLADGVSRATLEAAHAGKSDVRQVVVPIRDPQHTIVAVLVYEYTPLYAQMSQRIGHSLRVVGLLTLAGMLLAFGCGLFLARSVGRPLRHLSDTALRLARGERAAVVAVHGNDEIASLATAFNTMNQHLQLRERAIASSSNAIVIARLDEPGFPIEFVNPAFERITGYSAAEAIGRGADFLAGDDLDQPAVQQLVQALQQRSEANAVLRSRRKDGTLFWNEVSIAPVQNDAGPPEHCVAIFNDITRARADAEAIAHQAQFDALTGLANRLLLQDRLGQAIANAGRRHDSVVVVFIDLDDFKLVNDTLGHDQGDALLKVIAGRLQHSVRTSDTVARLGGDEFVLLLLNQSEHDGVLETHITEQMRKLLASIAQPVMLAGRELRVSSSIGVAMYPQDGVDADSLLKNADVAMYRAKELGRNGFQFFTAALHERVTAQLELGASLRLALERQEFELYYQPQVSLHSGKVVGVEALLRWNHPDRGLVGPAHFIAYAEESSLIIPIGEWVLMTACAQNKAWQDAGMAPLPVAVNVSAKQCAQQDLEAVVRRALDASGLEARYLELELTESISMADPEKSVPLMERMKDIGVELSIDDFGTGYSNMSYLKRFPIDRLKLDISFVRDITTDPGSLAISDAIITMSHSLHLEVVAEGVETEGQLALLAGRRCDIVQGYLFSKPLPAADCQRLIVEGRRLPALLSGRDANAPAVLVLDDDHHLLEYLDLVLANEGYVVLSTTDPDAAFEMLACREVALVLCDQRMPAMSGVEFLSRVRRMYPQVVRIMLSAYEDHEATRQAINMGAVYKFIAKPLQADELTEVVADAFKLHRDSRLRKSA